MRRVIWLCAGSSLTLTLLFVLLFSASANEVFLTLAITAGTTAYHFWMRLAVGTLIHAFRQNRFNYRRKWFQPLPFERKLYRVLRIRQWGAHLPTYAPEQFSRQIHSWEEIAQAMCQAEIVHEVIAVLSFLPLFAAHRFGAFGVFLATSLLAAGYDLCFVMLQRFNRPRVIRVSAHQRPSHKEET